ncbi:glycosyltransferase family 2 protein [Flavobacterium luteum]|nr:glycosyltransferase family 2 protein [Flavobacterium luteum]
MIKISIVTPSFNQGKFIEDAIESVLIQDYANFEHIIIDGCSTDNTIEVLKKYPHLIWVSEKDEGQSDALNKGFKKATGNIIGWLNSDDMYLPNTFKNVVHELTDMHVDAVYGNYKFIDSNGKITRELVTQNSKKWMSVFYCFIPSTTFFFKRKIIDQGIFIDKSFHIAMDKEFFSHIYNLGFKIKKVNSFFAHFRWHDNNKSIDTNEVKETRLLEGLEIFNRYTSFKLPKNKFGLSVYIFFMNICGVYRTISRFLKIGLYGKQ